MRISTTFIASLLSVPFVSGAGIGWHFLQNGTSGVVALEAMVVSPTLVIMFDRATNDPLQIDGHTTWGALWNLKKHIATPLNMTSDSFCASGHFLSNGTMVSVGGNIPAITQAEDGRMGLRLFEPCLNPDGVGCELFDNPEVIHLTETRWYPTAIRIFDGSLLITGGSHEDTPFYNTDPVNSFEFFPKKDNGIPRNSSFLARTVPVNLFPRAFALPDGKVFIVANNQSVIYDVEKKTETRLPDIPNSVRVTNPFDGTAALLPLSPPNFEPEVLVCGGSNASELIPSEQQSTQTPASNQCSRITLTPEGIQRGWEVEFLPEGRIMPELILIPNGQLVLMNGGQTGFAAVASVGDLVGNSNADHPVLTPMLYTPSASRGNRFTRQGLPTTDIPRMYHSSISLTPQGNIFVAGSNPNPMIVNDTAFPSELRVQTLNPPFMTVPRPTVANVPKKLAFNSKFTVDVTIPAGLNTNNIQVALMDLGFSSHAFHSGQRLVFLQAQLSPNRRSLVLESPPNNRVFPPGPAWLFVTIDDVTSEATQVMLGTGGSPPVPDQGIRL